MILIIGGAFQGKKEYAKKTFGLKEEEVADGACCGEEELYQAKAVLHLHEFVRRSLKEGRDIGGMAERILPKNPSVILLCNELGSGVVPVEAFDREWREATGRLCCRLAAEAEEVHRVVCGIGMVIKHG